MTFRKALAEDLDRVLVVYGSVKNREFCTWNEYYPGEEEAIGDIRAGTLYVLEENSKIIGTLSVVPENELDGLPCWEYNDRAAEIARIAVVPEHQGHGIAMQMVAEIEKELLNTGVKAIHLLVAKINKPAYTTYLRSGFSVRGETFMYGNSYFACEKEIRKNV